jgi:hypothetical protein
MAGTREAEAGFAIGTYAQDHIEENARERADSRYGDREWTDDMVRLGLMEPDGTITERGWEQLNGDISKIERNSLAWMRRTFKHVRDDGHDSHDDLVGNFWFDPTNYDQAWLVDLASASPGRSERIDMNDASYGDLANTVMEGVSALGGSVLGGQITFFDVQPEDWETIEETLATHTPNARASRPWFGHDDFHNSYGVKIDGIENDFVLKPLGRQEEWPTVRAFQTAARSTWIRAKHARSGTAALKRWVKDVKPSQFYAKFGEDDDSFQVWYTGGELGGGFAPGQSPNSRSRAANPSRQSDKINVNQIAALLKLPEYDSVHESNIDGYIGEAGSAAYGQALAGGATEEEAEEADMKAQEEADAELFHQWHGGVMHARSAVLGHLQWIVDYPRVYGDTSAERMYERAMR